MQSAEYRPLSLRGEAALLPEERAGLQLVVRRVEHKELAVADAEVRAAAVAAVGHQPTHPQPVQRI